MAVFAGLVLLLSCGAVHTFNKGCYDMVGSCQTRFHENIHNQEALNNKCPYYDTMLTCLTETSTMSDRCKASFLKMTKASCLDEKHNCDKDMCSKADGFIASHAYRSTDQEEGTSSQSGVKTCHGDQECRRRSTQSLAVASSHRKCSMYQEDYKCYDAIPKICNFSGKAATQKHNCVSKCQEMNVSVNENCELKDAAQPASHVSSPPASMTTMPPAVIGSHNAGRETGTAIPIPTNEIPSGTADDDDNTDRLSGNTTVTGNDDNTPSPPSGERKSGAGLMRAPVSVIRILLVWSLGHLM